MSKFTPALVLEDYGSEQKVIHDTGTRTMIIVEREGAEAWGQVIMAIPELLLACDELALHFCTGTVGNLNSTQINNFVQAIKKARGME
jgi:hypothetical protein